MILHTLLPRQLSFPRQILSRSDLFFSLPVELLLRLCYFLLSICLGILSSFFYLGKTVDFGLCFSHSYFLLVSFISGLFGVNNLLFGFFSGLFFGPGYHCCHVGDCLLFGLRNLLLRLFTSFLPRISHRLLRISRSLLNCLFDRFSYLLTHLLNDNVVFASLFFYKSITLCLLCLKNLSNPLIHFFRKRRFLILMLLLKLLPSESFRLQQRLPLLTSFLQHLF